MKEFYDFRIYEEYADRLLSESQGERLSAGLARKLIVTKDDPLFWRIGELEEELEHTENHSFFASWQVKRIYTKSEFASADLFLLNPTSYFEPSFEECGTIYDESVACPVCGAGAKAIAPIRLDLRRVPKKDVAVTIAREIVVSQRFVDVFMAHGITGSIFRRITHMAENADYLPRRYLLEPLRAETTIVAPTKIAITPFDHDNRTQCTRNDTLGWNQVSEITIDADTIVENDIFASNQFIGSRGGMVRQGRLIFLTPKVIKIMIDEKLTGVGFEIVRLSRGAHSGDVV